MLRSIFVISNSRRVALVQRISTIFAASHHLPQKDPFLIQGSRLSTATTSSAESNQLSLAYTYLVNKCGLSPEAASVASKKLARCKITDNADTVLRVLRDCGFSKTDIKTIVARSPVMLCKISGDVLKPKIDFLREFGFTTSIVAKKLTSVWGHSLKNAIIPSLDFLKTLLGSDEDVVIAVNRCPNLIHRAHCTIAHNLKTLRDHKVPEARIRKLLMYYPGALACSLSRFNSTVEESLTIGFDPSDNMFIYAIAVLQRLNRKTWEKKIAVLRSFGLPDEEINSAIRKFPVLLTRSEEKIRQVMDFGINKLDISPSIIIRFSPMFSLSFEKSIVPRCSVLNILMARGLLRKNITLVSALCLNKPTFMKNFVIKFENEVPEVKEAYKGNIKFTDFFVKDQNAYGCAFKS